MILILNCMLRPDLAADFNRSLQRLALLNGKEAQLVHVSAGEAIPPAEGFSHIILSGSEASAVEERPWNKSLEDVIRCAIDGRIPFLGICYGHQFLARVLCGRSSVRKASSPEFGWTKIRVQAPDNPLFAGTRELVTMVSHYDEVRHEMVPKELTILATSDACRVHAFQLRDLPMWGVQFHPEQDLEGAEQILTAIIDSDPRALIDRTMRTEFSLERNDRIFRNFLSLPM
jgi:GMP synthase-like glutamine amidotransferase